MRRVVLDGVRSLGAVRLAAVAEVEIHMRSGWPLVGIARKSPRYVLVDERDTISVLDLRGTEIAAADFEKSCPGLLAEFRAEVAN